MSKENDLRDVKCGKCDKEYQLKKGENPSNFHCECGGTLEVSSRVFPEKNLLSFSPEDTQRIKKYQETDGISQKEKVNGRFLASQTLKLDMLIEQNNKIIERNDKIIELLEKIANNKSKNYED